MDMVRGYQSLYREDKPRELFKWITLLSRFNNGKPLTKDLITEIEGFFDYYWKNDRMRALNSEQGERFIHELPSNISETIIIEFLFRDFLFLFKSAFNYRKQKKMYYLNFKDRNCREKMKNFLICLEPRFYLESGPLIQDQNHEVSEILFIMKGRVGVGYRIFNELFLGMQIYSRQIINDYAMINEKVSEFIYMPIIDNVEGLALRKSSFK